MMAKELTRMLTDAEFVEEMKLRQVELQRDIRVIERVVAHVYEEGESFPGEISAHLSDLDELRPREWFAGALVSILTEGKLPEVKRPMKKRLRVDGQITDFMIETARAYPIENLIQVNRGGKALCPFHDDHHPSMSVKGGLFHCFSCQAGGDAISFVMKINQLNFIEAVRYLNGR